TRECEPVFCCLARAAAAARDPRAPFELAPGRTPVCRAPTRQRTPPQLLDDGQARGLGELHPVRQRVLIGPLRAVPRGVRPGRPGPRGVPRLWAELARRLPDPHPYRSGGPRRHPRPTVDWGGPPRRSDLGHGYARAGLRARPSRDPCAALTSAY